VTTATYPDKRDEPPLATRPVGASPTMAEVREFFEEYRQHTNMPERELAERLADVEAEIAIRGTYDHTTDELTVGARLAFRNHLRCIGRPYWRSLSVRDCRHVKSATEVRDACIDHLDVAANGGKVRPVISVFAPDSPSGRGPRVRNRQLVSYAGYRGSDGSALGDPQTVALTELAQAHGWSPGTPGRFDLLPLMIETSDGRLSVHALPPSAAREVHIAHPTFPGISELGLRWYGFPTVSDMALCVGGITYQLAPFSGWYVAPEISARDFTDPHRYNLLPQVAAALGLDTGSSRSLWRDRAMIELTAAVLFSYERDGLRIDDHHAATDRFHRYTQAERRRGREVDAEWAWMIPPLSPSATPVFHETYGTRQKWPNFVRLPALDDGTPRGTCPYHGAGRTRS
jgi:nitric-oxide synthase, bacterial